MKQLPNQVMQFESMAEFGATVNAKTTLTGLGLNQDGNPWLGGVKRADYPPLFANGDTSKVSEAERLVHQLNMEIETMGVRIDTEVAGFAPCIPEFIGGNPECMFAMGETTDAAQPLRVLVNVASSSSVDAGDMMRRGVAVMAAVMALSASRPVLLEAVVTADSATPNPDGSMFCAVRVPINSAPLDLASACFALCHQAFSRDAGLGRLRALFQSPLTYESAPGFNLREQRIKKNADKVVELLGEDPANVLYIPDANADDTMISKPAEWVARVVEQYGSAAAYA